MLQINCYIQRASEAMFKEHERRAEQFMLPFSFLLGPFVVTASLLLALQ